MPQSLPTTDPLASLLSARLFISPQLVGEQLYFLSDLSGRLSLYRMAKAGGVPQPLLPQQLALQNPELMSGDVYVVLPKLGKILLVLDQDGDENYEPCFLPIDGGIPEPILPKITDGKRTFCYKCDTEKAMAVFSVDPLVSPEVTDYRVNLKTLEYESLGSSRYFISCCGVNADYSKVLLKEMYTYGDHVIYLLDASKKTKQLLLGKPIEQRQTAEKVPNNGAADFVFTPGETGLLFITTLFADNYGVGYMAVDSPNQPEPVKIAGLQGDEANGELEQLKHLSEDRYLLKYNIDGCSRLYECSYTAGDKSLQVERVIGGGEWLRDGVMQSLFYSKESNQYTCAFSTATTPTQLYTLEGLNPANKATEPTPLTAERLLALPQEFLSPGEDASYESHDGTRVSARVYFPAERLGFQGQRPVIFYIHGGPQSQEKPNFAWFSMPLIQYFTLRGFAVFVPNVRGSSGYGINYMKQVDHDWGGKDRLDHVTALKFLAAEYKQIDTQRAGVMGRSYGGFMTLTLAARHPELWRAACDMFGPYDLLHFMEGIPETWKTYFYLAVGHPERDRDFLLERSPKTYLHQLSCPLLVIQGKNDARVIEAESTKLVRDLREQGKEVDYLLFEDEGHDILKYANKLTCYTSIVEFFTKHLKP